MISVANDNNNGFRLLTELDIFKYVSRIFRQGSKVRFRLLTELDIFK